MALTQVSEKGIKDGEILNADINASAAIAGSKIAPDFGSQNIVTTGGLTIDTTTLKVDASNNRVGIGTSSPSTNFEVQTAAGERVQFLSNGSNQQPRIDLTRDAGIDYSIINAIGSYQLKKGSNNIHEYASDTHRFSIDGTEKVRIDSSGNVSIGSTSSVAPLNVKAETDGNLHVRPIGSIASAPAGSGVGLDVLNDANSAVKDLALRGSTTIFRNASAETMRITSTGRIGIGTTSPAAPVHVVSDANNMMQLVSTDRYSTMYLVDSVGSTFIQCDSGVLRFGVGGGAGAAGGESEAMRIGSTGLIGIGTNSPQTDLHIESGTPGLRLSDSGNSSAYCLFDGNGANLNIHADKGNTVDNTTIGFGIDNNIKMLIESSGNVGIGTTNPGQRLEVRQTAASHAIIAVNRPNSDTFCVALGNTSGNKAVISSNNTDLLFGRDFSGTFTERMRMRNDGGLTFNGDTSAANALDDYEEGTFTPTSNNDLGAAEGSYTKIGRQVTLHIRVTVDSNTNNNAMVIGGFPFTPSMPTGLSNGSTPAGFGYISGSVITGGIQIHTRYNVNECQFYTFTTNLKRSHFSGRELRFGLVYHV